MLAEPGQRKILVCALVAFLGLDNHVLSQSRKASLKSHRHTVLSDSIGAEVPGFSMVETSLEPTWKKEDLKTSPSRKYDAFTVFGTRLFLTERRTQKIFEIGGLPLEWRPFSDLTWADNETLMFDRWSQPHYGIHYVVRVKSRKLVVAAPFADKFYLEQQRPNQNNRRP